MFIYVSLYLCLVSQLTVDLLICLCKTNISAIKSPGALALSFLLITTVVFCHRCYCIALNFQNLDNWFEALKLNP